MLTTGFKALDKKVGSYIGLNYYEMLMAKISADKDVKRTKNTWEPLLLALKTQGIAVVLPKRA